VERTRTTSSVRRDDPGEFRVGRLKHERVKVPRGESLMEWAENVMQIHADRKSVLEVPLYKFLFVCRNDNQSQSLFFHCIKTTLGEKNCIRYKCRGIPLPSG